MTTMLRVAQVQGINVIRPEEPVALHPAHYICTLGDFADGKTKWGRDYSDDAMAFLYRGAGLLGRELERRGIADDFAISLGVNEGSDVVLHVFGRKIGDGYNGDALNDKLELAAPLTPADTWTFDDSQKDQDLEKNLETALKAL